MSKINMNPSAFRTIIQINSTLNFLFNKGVIVFYNEVPRTYKTERRCQITWYNHVPGRINCGDSFNKLGQYEHILKTNSYHGLLFDGSVIRVNFAFEDDLLLTQNLLWWPSPYDFSTLLQDFAPIDILYDLYGDSQWFQSITMRSPIRIDFDSTNSSIKHSSCHVHIQNAETRLFIKSPICFNRFVQFILKNFYPQYDVHFLDTDFIKYKTPNLKRINSHYSELII